MSYLPMILFQENYINASIYLRKKNIYALRKKKKTTSGGHANYQRHFIQWTWYMQFFFLFACLLYPSGHKKKINVFLPNSNGVIKSLNTKTLKKKKKLN